MAKDEEAGESFSRDDIIFECPNCGKSLVINALGAGLLIVCPDCGAELQVPPPNGAAAPVPESGADENDEQAEEDLSNISEVLADAREQIGALTIQVTDLKARRRFLEKRHALVAKGLQTLREEVAAIRAAVDRMDEVLKTVENHGAGDARRKPEAAVRNAEQSRE